ncbi:MAG TPA: SpoIIE family protein phosphatase [Spirochaetota bacterium]|nr:SpoIIE family protein phosphatase [Spirochaetota bacterium]
MKRRSLRRRLLVSISGVFLLMVVVGTLINYVIANQMFSRFGLQYTEEILRAKRVEFDRTFARNIDSSVFLSKSSLMREWLKDENDPQLGALALGLMREMKEITKETDIFAAADASLNFYLNGKMISKLSKDKPDDSWYWMTRDGRAFNLNIDHNDVLGTTKLWVNILVQDGENKLGVIGTGLDISSIVNDLMRKISTGASVMVFDSRGYIKAHQNERHIQSSRVYDLVRGVDITNVMKTLGESTNKSLIINARMKNEGETVSGSFSFIQSTGWYMLVTMDVDQILAAIFLPFIITLVASLLVVAIVLFFFIKRMVLQPLMILGSGLDRIKEKDFSSQITLASGDEFGDVAQTVNMMTENIRNYTENLELLVEARTKELQMAFNEVHSLKVQQDGDYFLTSLLINPLLEYSVQTEKVFLEARISQKKKFRFRSHDGEIGGDVCIARQVSMHDKRYTAFVNGDAMGKSLQGAGGALVLSVIFNAYVNRTHVFGTANHPYPEKWLRQCYNELQTVFTSFDGSMMMSVIVGLLDEESGMLYYFNAEHPYPVLYRGGIASFADCELSSQKLGSFGTIENLKLRTMQVESGDVLILGSDGRDDILLGHDALTGARLINEDETLFLRFVEEGDGDLDKILDHLNKAGEITDDLSLMRIAYTTPARMMPGDYAVRRDAAISMIHEGSVEQALNELRILIAEYPDRDAFKAAIGCCQRIYRGLKSEIRESDLGAGILRVQAEILEDAHIYFPLEKEYMYLRAYTAFQLGNTVAAHEYAERFRLYYPEHVNNLVILAESALRLKKLHKAELVVGDIARFDPDNSNLDGFRQRILTAREKA